MFGFKSNVFNLLNCWWLMTILILISFLLELPMLLFYALLWGLLTNILLYRYVNYIAGNIPEIEEGEDLSNGVSLARIREKED